MGNSDFAVETVKVTELDFANFDFSIEKLFKMRADEFVEDTIIYALTHTAKGYVLLSLTGGDMVVFSDKWGNWSFERSRYPCHGKASLEEFVENVMICGKKASLDQQAQLCRNERMIAIWEAYNEICLRIAENEDHEREIMKIKDKMRKPRY